MHAAVRRDGVTGLEQDDVAGHELGGVQHDELAVAHDLGLRGAHLLQGREGLLALSLLNDAEGGVDDDDRHDDDDVREVDLALNGARHRADGRRSDEHDDHRIGHLLEEANPQRGLLLFLQLVGAELRGTGRGLRAGETSGGVSLLSAQDLGGCR